MKHLQFPLFATLLIFALVVAPAIVCAQEIGQPQSWTMEWVTEGNTPTFSYGLAGTSPTVLVPTRDTLPPFFTGQAFNLTFTHNGHQYGGLVATGPQFQAPAWSAPAPCQAPFADCTFRAGSANGTFNFSDATHFVLDVFLGLGHTNAHVTGLGTRGGGGPVATAFEPFTTFFGVAGMAGAAVLYRRRRR
jgi:LPXTG cell wall anchor motif